MIHTQPDFFNKLALEIRSTYFPTENHGTTQNPDYHKASYTMECFHNGALNYRKLIGRLAKSCKTTTKDINAIVEKYIVSFGEYRYKPKKV